MRVLLARDSERKRERKRKRKGERDEMAKGRGREREIEGKEENRLFLTPFPTTPPAR